MKIVSLMGSPRTKGNTDKILSAAETAVLEYAAEKNTAVEISRINLADKNILRCRGCRICFDRGESNCPLKDDVLDIKSELDSADAFIFASPVFVEDVPGATKDLIDRLAFICHRPCFFGKSALLLSTAGVFSSGHELETLDRALSLWGAVVSGKASFKAGATIKAEEVSELYGDKIKKISGRFAGRVISRRAVNPSFISLMKFRIQQKYWLKRVDGSVDYTYWRDSGMLEKSAKYPSDISSGSLKVFFARLTGDIIAKFVI